VEELKIALHESKVSVGSGFMNSTRALVWSLRPYQWVKNTLVFAGLIFSHSLVRWESVRLSSFAFLCFCLASSGVYLANDLRDLEEDRQHPTKRLRPLAAGALEPRTAVFALMLLLLCAFVGGYFLKPMFGVVLLGYVVLNAAYTLWLKHLVILDVMTVAIGFILRAVGGAVVIGVTASPWLILCTLMLALLVGFGKRRNELTLLEDKAQNHRRSLEGYSTQFLDLMMAVTACAVVVTYALYTMADETVARFGTRAMVLTTPWVLYGVFRYFYLVLKRSEGGDPSRLFISDLPMMINALLWVIVVCFILYGPKGWLPW
jgi:4-hydroxybenzoate polyprenyltransferase